MKKRLQVVLPDQEWKDIQNLAKLEQLTVGEWVRRALRNARKQKPRCDQEAKMQAIRQGAEYSYPTADIGEMLAEIERGYRS